MSSIFGFAIAFAIVYFLYISIDADKKGKLSDKLGNLKWFFIFLGTLFFPLTLFLIIIYMIVKTYKRN